MKLCDFALKNRTTVFVLMFIILVAGTAAYIMLPREAAPDIQIPYVGVTAFYEGVAPSDMETLVTLKLEKELKALKDVKEMRSTTVEGFSQIMIEFEPEVDIDDALQKVREKVDLAQPELPPDMEDEPTITEFNFSEMPIIYVNINGADDQVRLKYIADELEDRLEAIPGVLKVDVSGDLEREIRLEFDPDRLAAYQIDPYAAVEAVASNNLNVPSGSLELGEAKYNVKVPGEFKDPNEINNIVIAVRNGRPVYLLDVAEVVDGFKERETYSRLNGKPTVTLGVSKRSGENIIRIIAQVKALLGEAEQQLPAGVSFSLTSDQSEDIRMMVSDLENNFLSGLILITIVVFFALGWRDAVVVSTAIPFSMLLAFVILYGQGLTLNMVVLFSLTLSLGMLVDNAIVIVENIHRHHNDGLRRIAAAHAATREVAWPITTSCITTICAFFPMLFWPGIMGEFMGFLPRTVIVTLACSLFVALVINPSVSSVVLKKAIPEHPKDFRDTKVAKFYVRLLHKMLKYRWAVLILAFGSLVVMVKWFQAKDLGTELFPEAEPDRATVNVKLPEGASLEKSDTIVRLVERAAMEYEEVENVIANVGAGLTGESMVGQTRKNNASHVNIEFVDREFRKMASSKIIEALRDDLAGVVGAEITVNKAEEGPPTGMPISLELSGPDFERLGMLAREIRDTIRTIPGLVDLKDDYIHGKPELLIRVDKEKAALLGLSTSQIGYTLRAAIQGAKAGVYRVGNDEYDVMVRMPRASRSEVDTLKRMRIPSMTGAQVPLSSVADFDYESGLGSIQRVDERRTVTVTADVQQGFNANAVLAEAQQRMLGFEMPTGYFHRFAGQNEEQEESTAFLSKAFISAIFLIALVLVMQFDSLILPFIILTSVILSLTGVFLGLVLREMPFGIIMTGIGVISLAGVVVNNAIVLIDFIEKLRDQGYKALEAVETACAIRLRPVLLTATTTILGLIPMATGVSFNFRKLQLEVGGESSEWWGPMATAVIFGLAVATILTMGVVPCLYMILEGIRKGERAMSNGEDEAPQHTEAAPSVTGGR